MDKLSKNIRRTGGDLVAPKRPFGRRLLLPTEVELCDVLGITEDEYWIFVDSTAAYNGQRPKGYELIPDIRNDAVSAYIASVGVKAFWTSVGVAVASATVSYLLTPKPQEQKQGGSRRTADSIGNKKFAPQASFNSVQALAQIGDPIPLVFTNQTTINGELFGGLRVNSQLLWSQFVSLCKNQQLKALALFSHGTIETDPDYEGYAVGDTLLNTYNAYKVSLYFKDGSISGNNRIIKADKYNQSKLIIPVSQDKNDPFEIGVPNKAGTTAPTLTSKSFSGARNPTTQTIFGAYAPIPNCQICRLPYELVRAPRGATKEAIRDMARKQKKVEFARWPTRAGFIQVNNVKTKGLKTLNEGDEIFYQIIGMESGETNALQRVYDNDKSTAGYQEDKSGDAFNYRPHGVDDVDGLTTSIRENTDNLLAVGEQYLLGTALVICTEAKNAIPWTIQQTKHYKFKVVEAGELDIPVDNADLSKHCQNPMWYDPNTYGFTFGGNSDRDARYSLSDLRPIFWQQLISDTEFNYPRGYQDLYYAHDIYTGQRVALATVTNNRKCDVTEIGIKSTVYKRIQFANVKSQPNEEALDNLFKDRTNIQLGQVSMYIDRFSLFMLQARRIGDSNWQDLKNTLSNHTGLFAIKGNTPESQYNAITISHPALDQYEYRFKPYAGNYITRNEKWNQRFNLLTTDSSGTGQVSHFSASTTFGTFDVAFTGDEGFTITQDVASNPEWQLGETLTSTVGTVSSARLNGATSWVENPNFNGVITEYKKELVQTFNGNHQYNIVLWNQTNAPGWAAVHGWGWVLYGVPGQPEINLGKMWPNANTAWNQVGFIFPNGKTYVPLDPSIYAHPNGNNHHFWVGVEEYRYSTRTVLPLSHFSGSVAVTGGSGTGLKVNLKVYKQEYQTGQYYYKADWTLDPNNLGTGYKNGETVVIPWTAVGGAQKTINVQLLVQTQKITTRSAQNFNPYDALTDWNVYEGDENSNRTNPEHEIVYVNEILKPATNASDVEQPAKYSNLAFAGIKINSSKEWANFSQFSAYFKKGIEIEKLTTSGKGASNLFPEIAYALLTDTKLGAGKLVGANSVDRTAMANAAKYCSKNQFFWDGTISSKLNLRDFIFEHAGYCLLDFTIIGGKFSLKASVPVNANNEIDKTILPDIKCLFTDGNIKDLQVSFLNPEERQTFKAAVLYREEKTNGFPETKSLLIRENDPYGSDTDPIETFDLSSFCTSRQQAIYFAYFAIRSRRLIDHGLTFKTAPQYVQGLAPGDYFRLVSEVSHTSRFRNGAKLEDGTIVSKDDVSGSENVYYWEPGTEGVKSSTLAQAPNGVLFTVKNTTTENKVYKCESISYGEDGLLEVAGSHAPTETDAATKGQLSVMQKWGLNRDIPGFTVTEDQ